MDGMASRVGSSYVPLGVADPGAAPRLDVSRLLTPKDFERIQRLKAQRAEVASLCGAKRKRAEAELEAEEAQKLMAEYAKNRANSAASVANDNFGRALQ